MHLYTFLFIFLLAFLSLNIFSEIYNCWFEIDVPSCISGTVCLICLHSLLNHPCSFPLENTQYRFDAFILKGKAQISCHCGVRHLLFTQSTHSLIFVIMPSEVQNPEYFHMPPLRFFGVLIVPLGWFCTIVSSIFEATNRSITLLNWLNDGSIGQ